jgi:hypothetical protein
MEEISRKICQLSFLQGFAPIICWKMSNVGFVLWQECESKNELKKMISAWSYTHLL